MKCPLDSVTEDVQQLISRLKQRETTVDGLCNEIGQIQAQLSNIRQYQKEMMTLYEVSGCLTNTRPLHCLSAENEELEQLRVENQTLCDSLDDHEIAIDVVMNKYRLQMSQLVQGLHTDQPHVSEYRRADVYQKRLEPAMDRGLVRAQLISGSDVRARDDIVDPTYVANSLLTAQMSRLTSMARDICDQGDAYSTQLEAELHRLRSENAGLREMLMISSDFSVDQTDDSDVTLPIDVSESDNRGYHKQQTVSAGIPASSPDLDNFALSAQQKLDQTTGLSSLLRALDEFTPYEAAERDRSLSRSEDADEDDEDEITVADGSENID